MPDDLEFVIRRGAQREIENAAEWLEECNAGGGDRFIKRVKDALRLIEEHPLAWPKVDGVARRHWVRKTPYTIFYAVFIERIVVLGLAHASDRPDYWRKRILRDE